MVYYDHHTLIARPSSDDSYSLRSRNASPMKRATICLIVIITVFLLIVNIYGLLEIWRYYTQTRARPPSLETIIRKQQEENARKTELRIIEIDREEVEIETTPLTTAVATTARPHTWPHTWRATTRIRPTIDWAVHTRSRGRVTPWAWHTTTMAPWTRPTTRRTTTQPTTITVGETTTTTTRILVTRPPMTTELPTSHRIEVTRPHGHRHHGHHHHHHTSTTIEESTIETTTVETTTSSLPTEAVTRLIPQEVVTRPTTAKPNDEDLTIVTALIDIGRGDWWTYRRPLDKYHEFMENLLSLKNNMVIFVDSNSYDFVHKYRKNMGLMHITKIHHITFDDLPLSRHLSYAQKIIEDELKATGPNSIFRYDQSVRTHPEAKSAEYNVLVCSKSYFIYNATLEDPFNTESFAWIDAGYGHGNQSVYPYDNVWRASFPKNKVSLIKLTPEHDLISSYNITKLYRINLSVVSGGFIGGDKRALGQLHTIVHNRFIQLIYQNKVDDDQTVMVLAINSYPHLFNVVQGGWFDAFRLFSIDQETNFGR